MSSTKDYHHLNPFKKPSNNLDYNPQDLKDPNKCLNPHIPARKIAG